MTITTLQNWVVAHPYEFLLLVGAVLSFINASLPATVASSPFGKLLHAVLDRLSVLTRTDAPGTLKWPVVGSSILQAVKPVVPPPAPTPATPPTQEPSK
jgi:hypothetical protein